MRARAIIARGRVDNFVAAAAAASAAVSAAFSFVVRLRVHARLAVPTSRGAVGGTPFVTHAHSIRRGFRPLAPPPPTSATL